MSDSKYQEALDRTKEIYEVICDELKSKELTNKTNEDVEVLQELVDKATPKRPILNKIWEDEDTKNIYDECGRINELLCVCPNCGQRIDWSVEDDR
ncbi:MAG: hypothetical protein ACLSU6_03645 [Thomasclavelia ramosa]